MPPDATWVRDNRPRTHLTLGFQLVSVTTRIGIANSFLPTQSISDCNIQFCNKYVILGFMWWTAQTLVC